MDFRFFRQLWLFLAVAEEKHFGRASKRLGLSQPPLTEHIKALEQKIGHELFIRSRRKTSLSPTGMAILPAVKQFMRQAENLKRTIDEVVSGQVGVLRIGAITAAMVDIVPRLRNYLENHHPSLAVMVQEIDSGEAAPLLEADDIDLAFARIDDSVSEILSSKALLNDTLAVALPQKHRLSYAGSIAFEDLAKESFVMPYRQLSPSYFDLLTSLCHAHGFTPCIRYEVRSILSQLGYVSCGQGIALVPASIGRLAPENVIISPLKRTITIPAVTAVWKKKNENIFVPIALDFLK